MEGSVSFALSRPTAPSLLCRLVQRRPGKHLHPVPEQQRQHNERVYVLLHGWLLGHRHRRLAVLLQYALLFEVATGGSRDKISPPAWSDAVEMARRFGAPRSVCPSGTFSVAGATSCTNCPTGSISNSGATTCTCTAGYSTSGTGSTLACTGPLCGPGPGAVPTTSKLPERT